MTKQKTFADWMKLTRIAEDRLKMIDALIPGAERLLAFVRALALNIPVFYSLSELKSWHARKTTGSIPMPSRDEPPDEPLPEPISIRRPVLCGA